MNLRKISSLFSFEKGTLQSSKCEAGPYDFITAASDWKTHKEYTHDCESLIFAAAAAGSLGRTHYVNGKFITSDLCFILTPKDDENFPIDMQFYHMIFRELRADIVARTKAGTSKESISLGKFGSYELPYFPIEIQSQLKANFVQAEQTRDRLNTELSRQLELVRQLRQAFLREAMQGKLVPQDEADESADILITRCKAQKSLARKSGNAGDSSQLVETEEMPFEIPSNWVWCRFEDLLSNIRSDVRTGPFGSALNKSEHQSDGIPVWGIESISKDGKFTGQNKIFVNERKAEELKSFFVQSGDLIISRSGTIAELCVLPVDTPKGLISTNLMKISVDRRVIHPQYFCYFIKGSPYVRDKLADVCSGSTRLFLTQAILKKLIFALPPLDEQLRIIERLESLMNLCDDLEANIRQGKSQADLLLQIALKEALEPKSNVKEEESPQLALSF